MAAAQVRRVIYGSGGPDEDVGTEEVEMEEEEEELDPNEDIYEEFEEELTEGGENNVTPNIKGIRIVHRRSPNSAPAHLMPPKAVHQCNVCNKIFVSFKGLQQHAVIHTDQKPFACDICGKSFRFKSNLFEHRTVHSGFTPHACPYCGKTCRLKGNLKKHLKTHVNSKEELDEAWKPFASNRRPPQEIPEDAIIVRSTGEPYYTTPSRPRKKKLGLGPEPKPWVDKIRRGDLFPTAMVQEKMNRLADLLKSAEDQYFSFSDVMEQAKAIPLERFDCPLCKQGSSLNLGISESTGMRGTPGFGTSVGPSGKAVVL